jgi:hypothetical protein
VRLALRVAEGVGSGRARVGVAMNARRVGVGLWRRDCAWVVGVRVGWAVAVGGMVAVSLGLAVAVGVSVAVAVAVGVGLGGGVAEAVGVGGGTAPVGPGVAETTAGGPDWPAGVGVIVLGTIDNGAWQPERATSVSRLRRMRM